MKPVQISIFPPLLVLFFLVSISGYCQSETIIKSKITNVTVFLSKAQITRVADTNIMAGKSIVVFNNLPAQLDDKSIQVKGSGDFIILGVSSRLNYLNNSSIPLKLKELQDSLKYLKTEITIHSNRKSILLKEEDLLLQNQKIGGENQNMGVSELKELADFFRHRMTEISSLILKLDNQLEKLKEELKKIKNQINQQNEIRNRHTREIIVSLSSKTKTTAHFSFNYLVNSAGWKPTYDFRALSGNKFVVLNYKATVFQRTGEEWKNVHITLSTSNPSLGGLYPSLHPQYLDIFSPEARKISKASNEEELSEMVVSEDYAISRKRQTPNISEFITVEHSSINITYDISVPYTVSSSSQPTLIDVQQYEIATEYSYIAIPKLDPDAFLIAKIAGWEDLNLLKGEANIFFDGTFVSKTFIDPKSVNDTIVISLGRDRNVVVEREKRKEYTSRKTIGTNITESIVYELSVRNTKPESITIEIVDQLPISKDSRIEVNQIDIGKATRVEASGELSWTWRVEPKKTKNAIFKFDIKYPKGKKITGL